MFAGLLKSGDVEIPSKPDRGVLFAAAVTNAGDVLTFIAKDTGNWLLYRVRNWNEKKASIESLTLPGYFSKADRPDMEMLNAQVLATADGAFAVCVGSAEWLKRAQGRATGPARSDDVMTIVDLAAFRIVGTSRTRDLDLFEFHELLRLDSDGHLLAESLSSGKPKQGSVVRFAIPSLEPSPPCVFDWVLESPRHERRVPHSEEQCREALRSSFSAFFATTPQPVAWPPKGCANNKAKFCRLPGILTADGKFGIAIATEGHDNLLGNWVETKSSYVIFSAAKSADIGEINVPTRDSVRTATFALNDRDFLLIALNGTRLRFYELRD
jgi:hypothetical protein